MDIAIQKFIGSDPVIISLLVISYDMFRIYAEAINTCHFPIELLICDEGHRMKNHIETKTNIALQQCVAQRRVILTGTPIQNNLYELYALIQFILPNYLAELIPSTTVSSSSSSKNNAMIDPCKSFEEHFIQKISAKSTLLLSLPFGTPRSKEEKRILEDGSHAEQQLQDVLSKILLRRTKEEILSKILPTRYDYILLISPLAHDSTTTVHDNQEIGSETSWEESYRRVYETSMQSLPTSSMSEKGKMKGVLPALMQVRLFCSHGNSTTAPLPTTTIPNASHIPVVPAVTPPPNSTLQAVCGNSSKLWTCFYLLQYLRTHRTQEKIIIASNFQETLSTVKQLCRLNHWSTLRIDGSCDASKRQKILEFFQNNTRAATNNDICPILLLSTHAGGVGLNITAANHCILCDPDWNPAIDQQTFGRIYRDGQSKETFIYRLIMQGSIEETILARQSWKNELIRLLPTTAMSSSSSSSVEAGGMKEGKKRRMEENATDLSDNKRARKDVEDNNDGEIVPEAEEEEIVQWLENVKDEPCNTVVRRKGMPIGNSIDEMVFPTSAQCQALYSKQQLLPSSTSTSKSTSSSSSDELTRCPIVSELFHQHAEKRAPTIIPTDYPRFGREIVLTIHKPTPYAPSACK